MSPNRKKGPAGKAKSESGAAKRGGATSKAEFRPDVPALDRFLRSIGVDSERDPEYTVTAALLAELLVEQTSGLREEPPMLRPMAYQGNPGETVALEGIAFHGLCPHHLVPYTGEARIRYSPREQICGAGALARLVRDLARVPRLQENLTQAIADAVHGFLEPHGVEVEVRARHLCIELRGPESRAHFVTEARRGSALPGRLSPGRKTRGPRR
jgi:GTP cyclohydrolase I